MGTIQSHGAANSTQWSNRQLHPPPLIDQMPFYQYENQQQTEQIGDQWAHNPHITGLAITGSVSCGQPMRLAYRQANRLCGLRHILPRI